VKIELEVSENKEATAYPYWMIIDPRQNFHGGNRGVAVVASMITGPFFSRKEAEFALETRRHHFGVSACVYCLSGHMTEKYRAALDKEE